jgi:hypothetical protein
MYYRAALGKAWEAIKLKLEIIKRQLNVSEVRLESVKYNTDSYISRIEELPDEPKAPSPDQLEVKLEMEVVYTVIQ